MLILACACHVPGVNTSADSSRCDSNTGQCACKSHVTGRACDMCHDSYWKLTMSNEAGCEGKRERQDHSGSDFWVITVFLSEF